MNYAIIDAGGKQFWLESGKYYDLDYIPSNPGDILSLNRVLLIRSNNEVKVGKPCVAGAKIKARVLKHLRGRKLIVFKMKPKKNMRVKKGHRQKMTRVLIQDILF